MKIVIPCPPTALSFAGIVIGISTGIAAHHWWPSLLVIDSRIRDQTTRPHPHH